jgi:hypothetical protein
MEFGQQFRNLRRELGSFFMPQSWDMGQIILISLRRKACCGFFQPEKSDGFTVGSEPAILGTRGPHANP